MTERPGQSGFTLIEVLVAFSIAAVSLGLLFQIHSSAAKAISLVEDYSYAADLAASLIAEHSLTKRELAFAENGLAGDRYSWTVEGRRYEGAFGARALEPNAVERTDMELREIDVTIAWMSSDRERQFQLTTLRPFLQEESE